jgi:hypothetical protein
MEGWVIVIGIAGVVWILNLWVKSRKYDDLKPRIDRLDAYRAELEKKDTDLHKRQEEWERKVQSDITAIETLAGEKSEGFPWLAQAYANYFHLQDLQRANYLERKSHPAKKAAEHIREIAGKRKTAERLHRILKYQLDYYEDLFPWLVEFKGEDLDELVQQIVERSDDAEVETDEEDPAKRWLTAAEYEKLPTAEKYQLALDRYWQKKKTSWEVGRDYERYIGYLYERDGWAVEYQGIIEGLADLGRDLIAVKNDTTQIVQCKYWSQEKLIHEKHVLQLYGTVVAYAIDHTDKNSVMGVLFTSTALSPRASEFAAKLGIAQREQCPLQTYPFVKCNVSRRDGSKIYHLPFDQQYDRTVIEEERMERRVSTVKEAEALGFRRAFRWRGGQVSL